MERGQTLVSHLYLLSSVQRTIAVLVGDHQRAAALDELGEIGIVIFRTGENYLNAVVGLCIGFAGLEILERFTQIREDQILRADHRDEI